MTDQVLDFNQQVIAELRANGGVVGGMFEGRNILLPTTVGAKSGEKRVSPWPTHATATASSSPPRSAAHQQTPHGSTTS